MAFDAQVKAAEPVAAEAIGPSLQHNGLRPEGLHDVFDDGSRDVLEVGVIETLAQGEVDAIARP